MRKGVVSVTHWLQPLKRGGTGWWGIIDWNNVYRLKWQFLIPHSWQLWRTVSNCPSHPHCRRQIIKNESRVDTSTRYCKSGVWKITRGIERFSVRPSLGQSQHSGRCALCLREWFFETTRHKVQCRKKAGLGANFFWTPAGISFKAAVLLQHWQGFDDSLNGA